MRHKGVKDLILDKFEEMDDDRLVCLASMFTVILVIIALAIMVVLCYHERQNCIDTIIQQYSSASVEELKQRIELCNM